MLGEEVGTHAQQVGEEGRDGLGGYLNAFAEEVWWWVLR